MYQRNRKPDPISGKTAIIVDDGIATGMTMLSAIREIKLQKPAKIVVAVPVAPKDTVKSLSSEADEVTVLLVPDYFAGSIGAYYQSFEQVQDSEVIDLLKVVTLQN